MRFKHHTSCIPIQHLPYLLDDALALGITVDDWTGMWLVPYDVLFPLGSTLDWASA